MTDTYKKENVNKKLTIKSRDWLHREQCTIFEESDAPGAIINQIIKDNLFDIRFLFYHFLTIINYGNSVASTPSRFYS